MFQLILDTMIIQEFMQPVKFIKGKISKHIKIAELEKDS